MGWFDKFVSGLTGDSTKEVNRVHHTARDDSGVREGKDKGHFEKAPSWADAKEPKSGVDYFPKDKH